MLRGPAIHTYALSARERQILWLFGGEGMPAKHVAVELRISIETTNSYIKRVRRKLRERPNPIPADSRVDLFMAALGECTDMPICLATRNDLLRYLLSEDAPERVSPDPVGVG